VPNELSLALLIFAAAVLYSSVGHAGASGYLAAMALYDVAPAEMKPTALVLNILVATVATVRFYAAGSFSWRVFLPFACASVPFAFVGGQMVLPNPVYRQVVGATLLVAAFRLFTHSAPREGQALRRLPPAVGVACGAVIGLLSGLTGVGGGIYLTPLLLFTHWADTRQAAGVSAAFIFVNSVAGLAGHSLATRTLPHALPLFAVAAVAGGLIGSGLGSRRLGSPAFRRVLGVVLVIAAAKMLFAR
jgi:uncharacterized membrane protein YfcA